MALSQDEITQLLSEWSRGNRDALDRLLPVIYEDLKRVARRSLSAERSEHTLQTTALVHETYMRLVNQDQAHWKNRAQFFAVAAQLVRRILVDHARARGREKRGGGFSKISLEEGTIQVNESSPDLLALDCALTEFHKIDPRRCRVVELKFFGGLDAREIAEVLDISEVTVLRDWSFAKAWLHRELNA